jgi:hypothetical protein
MLFIHDDDKRSYCGKSLLPSGLRRRRAVCFTSPPPRWMASPSSPILASRPGGARNADKRDFYHGLLRKGLKPAQ